MYSFDGRIRYSEVDSDGKLTLLSLLNYFQDCSTFQSEDLGLGFRYMEEHKKLWVLSFWQIVVEDYPDLGERVKVNTHPYAFRSFLGYRNFSMTDREGNYYAKGNSLWSLIGAETFKPVSPEPEMLEKYVVEEKLPMDYASRKIALQGDGRQMAPIEVKPHHLDTNHHVNNGQYVAVAMDFLPEHTFLRQMRAEYKKQALLGDVFYPYVEEHDGTYGISLNDSGGSAYAVIEFQTNRESE